VISDQLKLLSLTQSGPHRLFAITAQCFGQNSKTGHLSDGNSRSYAAPPQDRSEPKVRARKIAPSAYFIFERQACSCGEKAFYQGLESTSGDLPSDQFQVFRLVGLAPLSIVLTECRVLDHDEIPISSYSIHVRCPGDEDF
jgi:hypothetical protein